MLVSALAGLHAWPASLIHILEFALLSIAHIPSDQSRGRMIALFDLALLGCGCLQSIAPTHRHRGVYASSCLTALRPVASAFKLHAVLPESPRLNSGRPISARPAHSIILSSADARPEHHAPFFLSEALSQPFCCSLSRGEAEPSVPSACEANLYSSIARPKLPLHSLTWHLRWFTGSESIVLRGYVDHPHSGKLSLHSGLPSHGP